jgi:hypothetical protein
VPLDPTPLSRLAVPTLILWSAQDRWVPVADAFRFQNDIKGAKLEIFEKLGHDPMEEAFSLGEPASPARSIVPSRTVLQRAGARSLRVSAERFGLLRNFR